MKRWLLTFGLMISLGTQRGVLYPYQWADVNIRAIQTPKVEPAVDAISIRMIAAPDSGAKNPNVSATVIFTWGKKK